ncbi:MAG: hypothetical protein KGJ86_21295, partial [Chloroflexota bacterium]|nr:hypothetical protein [Chloroflexota bacterium]
MAQGVKLAEALDRQGQIDGGVKPMSSIWVNSDIPKHGLKYFELFWRACWRFRAEIIRDLLSWLLALVLAGMAA